MPETVLKIESLTKEFPTRGEPLVVLKDVSLDCHRGESIAIIGPSGSGKSTLLHILGTLDSPTSGKVTISDRNPFELSENELAEFRNQQIGFVFQDHHLLPQCSVLENVLIPTLATRNAASDVQDFAKELLDRVGLTDRTDHRPAEISGGERQRAAIARALIHKPSLVLADEPTGNLDHDTADIVAKLFFEICREQEALMIAVTHNLDLAKQFDRQFEIASGMLREVRD